MPDQSLGAVDAALPSAPTEKRVEAAPAASSPDYDAIVWNTFNAHCTNSPFFRDPQTVCVVTERFLPALIAALKGA